MMMREILPLTLWIAGLAAGDVVTLKDGRQVSGSVESGNTQELHIKVGDQTQTIDVQDVAAIRFDASPAAQASSASAEPNTLFLSGGAQIAGKWWSVDATDVSFVVNGQLTRHPRRDVVGVTFGGAALPPAATASAAPKAVSPPPSPVTPAPTQPAAAPKPAQAPALKKPAAATQPTGPPRGVSQPQRVGTVYFWNGELLYPLERKQAAERKKGSDQFFEIPSPKSIVRVGENSRLIFILRLPEGVDPASYVLFELATVDGSRRTRAERGHFMTWQVEIEKNNVSSLITYNLTVRDLPTGEWAFSQTGSDDAFCFGVDPE